MMKVKANNSLTLNPGVQFCKNPDLHMAQCLDLLSFVYFPNIWYVLDAQTVTRNTKSPSIKGLDFNEAII